MFLYVRMWHYIRLRMEKDMEREFMEHYDQLTDPIFRYCYFKIGDREIAVDMVQEIFLKAWAYVSRGEVVENYRAFVYKLAHNMVVDWYRKKKTVSLDQLADNGFDPKDTSADTTIKAQIGHVLSVVSRLDQDDQDLIVWRYVEDKSPKEIAGMLKEKENTISVRLHRAIERLQKLLHSQE